MLVRTNFSRNDREHSSVMEHRQNQAPSRLARCIHFPTTACIMRQMAFTGGTGSVDRKLLER